MTHRERRATTVSPSRDGDPGYAFIASPRDPAEKNRQPAQPLDAYVATPIDNPVPPESTHRDPAEHNRQPEAQQAPRSAWQRWLATREGKTISQSTANKLKAVQGLHQAASAAIQDLLDGKNDDVAEGDGDDEVGGGADGTQSGPSTEPSVAQDATGSRSVTADAPVIRGAPMPGIQREFLPKGAELR